MKDDDFSDGEVEAIQEDNGTENENGIDSDTNSRMFMISTFRSFAAMGIYPKSPDFRLDAALIDTGSSHLLTIGEQLVQAAQIASVEKTAPN